MKDQNYLIKAYLGLALILMISAGLFYFNSGKWGTLLDLSAPAKEQAALEEEAEQEYLRQQGLTRDPAEMSYVEITTQNDLNLDDIETLRGKDTDQEGLNDYEELYLYRTSPYLADTDGDTYSDFLEIKNGTDPLCAEGKICGTDESNFDLAQKRQLLEQLSGAGETMSDWQDSLQELNFDEIPADVLRQALLESGMPEEELNALSDDDLFALYQQAKDELSEASPVTEESQSVIDEEALLRLSPAELRAILIQQGADPVKLEEISDDDLLYFLQESISESKNTQN
ncbi:MAG TPA: hypothetical protein PLB38_02680 [bacterium]|nr:hypothetical protein [bacterium]